MQTPIDFITKNRHTLNSHKWFLYMFINADIKHIAATKAQKAELLKQNIQKTIYYIACILCVDIWINTFILAHLLNLHLNSYGKIMLIVVSLLTAYIYESRQAEEEQHVYKKQPTVHLRFTRPSIFYKNTHYIFSGTKTELQRAFQNMRDNIDATKKEDNFGRADHDDLLDMPLDVFCNSLCECQSRTASEDNYNCSHWSLHSYDSKENLKTKVEELELLNISHTYCGVNNEILYL